MVRSALPPVAFATLMLTAGVVHGLRTDRWGSALDMNVAVDRLDAVPPILGDWRGEPETFDSRDVLQGGISGYRSYRYRNIITGDKVWLLIVCGRPGPISVHTPDVCYAGAGYTALGDEFRKEIRLPGGRVISVAAMRFRSPATLAAQQIEVSWAWNGGQGWSAPQNPRVDFARYRALYKLYVVCDVPARAAAKTKDPGVPFMQLFLPELERVLTNQPGS